MSEINDARIEQYVEGALQGAERVAFEQELSENAELAAATRLYADMYAILSRAQQDSASEVALRQMLAQKGKTHFAPQPAKVFRLNWKKRLAGIAAAGLSLFLVIRFLLLSPSLSTSKILAQTYTIPKEISVTRAGGSDNLLEGKAVSLYNDKKYEKAIPLLDSCLAADSTDTRLLLAKGIALFKTEKNEFANAIFTQIADGGSARSNEARFWQALVLVKQEQRPAAIALLKTLLSEDPRNANARQLLDDLD